MQANYRLASHRHPHGFYLRYGKRLGDLAFVAATAIVWVPVVAIVALLVRVFLGKGVIFSQMRGGYLCEPFRVHKFRTMTDERGPDGALLPDHIRLTAFGKFLRASSLDEVPGIFNILKGEMSFIGPRPFIYDYMRLYPDDVKRRHDVRPGITGWAQVNGRNAISWESKFDLDLYYVDNISIPLEFKILVKTVIKVVLRHDIDSETHATMERYRGPAG